MPNFSVREAGRWNEVLKTGSVPNRVPPTAKAIRRRARLGCIYLEFAPQEISDKTWQNSSEVLGSFTKGVSRDEYGYLTLYQGTANIT